jgi:radical SAM protein with 4Fe4S-binding SPASM domain
VDATYAKMRVGGNLERAKDVIKALLRRQHPNLWVRRVLTKDNAHEPFANMAYQEFGRDGLHVSEHYCFDRNEAQRHEAPGCDHDGAVKRTYCGYPSQRIVIASSGLAYPCCIDLHEEMPVGDYNTQLLTDIWHGEPMRKLRAELRAGQYKSSACINCQSWMSHDTPQRGFVQDVEVKP